MIADIMTNKKLQTIIKELFVRSIKPNISLVFVLQSYFSVAINVRLNSTHYLIMKITNRKELQNSFLTIVTTLPSDNPLRCRKKMFDTL